MLKTREHLVKLKSQYTGVNFEHELNLTEQNISQQA